MFSFVTFSMPNNSLYFFYEQVNGQESSKKSGSPKILALTYFYALRDLGERKLGDLALGYVC